MPDGPLIAALENEIQRIKTLLGHLETTRDLYRAHLLDGGSLDPTEFEEWMDATPIPITPAAEPEPIKGDGLDDEIVEHLKEWDCGTEHVAEKFDISEPQALTILERLKEEGRVQFQPASEYWAAA